MITWEYKTVVRSQGEMLTDEQLNLLGTHGLELVNVMAVTEQHKVVGRMETHTVIHYFFKRHKPAGAQPAQGAKPQPVVQPATPKPPTPSNPQA